MARVGGCQSASRSSARRPALRLAPFQARARSFRCYAASMQFIRGVEEPCIPDVKLTRSRDGSTGTASFRFDAPSVFEADNALGEITGLFMIDEEGELSTVDVNAKFINGKPAAIECRHIMRSPDDWDRFMRFMERYAEQNGLGFQQGKGA